MGLNDATFNGHRVTSARVSMPAWGCWWADVSIDGEVEAAGAAELRISDLTLKGTILSGGPAKGRSHFRIVAGAGGWGKTIPSKNESNDLGVTLKTILQKAAEEVGETLELGARANEEVGPHFVRKEGPASRVLQQFADRAWYVDEAGVTRLGLRPETTLDQRVAMGPVDRAAATVTFAAESIATILPGVVVDGLVAIDVEHEISEEGLRTTIYGKRKPTDASRKRDVLRRLVAAADPNRDFRGTYEYRVGRVEGKRLSLQPVRASTGMPDLRRVRVWPGVAGADAAVVVGSRVLVTFADAVPTRPVIVAFEDFESGRFVPTALNFLAGGMVGGEHAMTVEACATLIYNVFAFLSLPSPPPPLVTWPFAPNPANIVAAVNLALTRQATPAPPTEALQNTLAATETTASASGTPIASSAPFAAAIALVAAKTTNLSGKFPSVGAKAVKTG